VSRASGGPGRGGVGRLLAPLMGLLWALMAAAPAAASPCAENEVLLRGPFGQARFAIELADEPQERAQGLMWVTDMPLGSGMLFVFPAPQSVRFWMKNTPLSLDMLFIGPEGRVLRLHENAVPLDPTIIDGGPGVRAVLEINGGLAAAIGIGPGAEIRHPVFGPDAAWPCPDPG